MREIQRKLLQQISYCGINIDGGEVSELFQRIQGLHLYRATEARSFEGSYCAAKLGIELLVIKLEVWHRVTVVLEYFCYFKGSIHSSFKKHESEPLTKITEVSPKAFSLN